MWLFNEVIVFDRKPGMTFTERATQCWHPTSAGAHTACSQRPVQLEENWELLHSGTSPHFHIKTFSESKHTVHWNFVMQLIHLKYFINHSMQTVHFYSIAVICSTFHSAVHIFSKQLYRKNFKKIVIYWWLLARIWMFIDLKSKKPLLKQMVQTLKSDWLSHVQGYSIRTYQFNTVLLWHVP